MNTITEALDSLSEALAKKGFDVFDLGCDDDEDLILYAMAYMENHLEDILDYLRVDQYREANQD